MYVMVWSVRTQGSSLCSSQSPSLAVCLRVNLLLLKSRSRYLTTLARSASFPNFALLDLQNLTEDALVSILTEPKNALVPQFQALFKMDNVRLHTVPFLMDDLSRMLSPYRVTVRDSVLLIPHLSAEAPRDSFRSEITCCRLI